MTLIAVMTMSAGRYPTISASLASIAPQVDKAVLVLDPEQTAPPQLTTRTIENLEIIPSPESLGAAVKFCVSGATDDQILLCSDQLIYPPDYAARMRERWEAYRATDAVVGVEGVIYPDFFDGDPAARLVHMAVARLDEDSFVNQLGTGTILCGGQQMPGLDFMRTAPDFIDLRFAIYCAQRNRPRICISRDQGWLRAAEAGPDQSETFAGRMPLEVVAEAQQIAGFRFLPVASP